MKKVCYKVDLCKNHQQ